MSLVRSLKAGLASIATAGLLLGGVPVVGVYTNTLSDVVPKVEAKSLTEADGLQATIE